MTGMGSKGAPPPLPQELLRAIRARAIRRYEDSDSQMVAWPDGRTANQTISMTHLSPFRVHSFGPRESRRPEEEGPKENLYPAPKKRRARKKSPRRHRQRPRKRGHGLALYIKKSATLYIESSAWIAGFTLALILSSVFSGKPAPPFAASCVIGAAMMATFVAQALLAYGKIDTGSHPPGGVLLFLIFSSGIHTYATISQCV